MVGIWNQPNSHNHRTISHLSTSPSSPSHYCLFCYYAWCVSFSWYVNLSKFNLLEHLNYNVGAFLFFSAQLCHFDIANGKNELCRRMALHIRLTLAWLYHTPSLKWKPFWILATLIGVQTLSNLVHSCLT